MERSVRAVVVLLCVSLFGVSHLITGAAGLQKWTDYDAAIAAAEDVLAKSVPLNDAALREYIGYATISKDDTGTLDDEFEKCATFLSTFLQTRLGMTAATYESGYKYPIAVGRSSQDPSKPSVVIYGRSVSLPESWIVSICIRAVKHSYMVSVFSLMFVLGHYDVQPVDGEWTISEPFEMKKIELEGYGEVVTGRGR